MANSQRHHPLLFAALLVAGTTGQPWPAAASDGVLEINQTCAVQTGCFAGDTAGFPVTISAFGSYRLTGNLAVPDANTTAVQITATTVTLDLGGFGIRGVTFCGEPGPCAPTGSGRGVDVAASYAISVVVRNGSIFFMGGDGVKVEQGGIVENVRVWSNGGIGISAGEGATVRDCTAFHNGSDGIRTLGSSLVTRSISGKNNNGGIRVAGGSIVSGGTVFGNAGVGIDAQRSMIVGIASYGNTMYGILGDRSLITDNIVQENYGHGIDGQRGSVVSNNVSSFNAGHGISGSFAKITNNNTSNNDADGIRSPLASYLVGNVSIENLWDGISGSSFMGFRENLMRNNGTDLAPGTGLNMGVNICGDSATCP